VQEIKAAIQQLSPAERDQLAAALPDLFPELDGDAAWEGITRDQRLRPTLSALLDQVQDDYRSNPVKFRATTETEFDRPS